MRLLAWHHFPTIGTVDVDFVPVFCFSTHSSVTPVAVPGCVLRECTLLTIAIVLRWDCYVTLQTGVQSPGLGATKEIPARHRHSFCFDTISF